MRAESSKLPPSYLQPAPVRGQLEAPNQRSAPGWRYIQCTDTPNQFRVLLPPRTAELYEQLLRAETYELAKQPNLSWERILEIRHLKDRMIRKCQRLAKIVPSRKPVTSTPGGFAPQTGVAPTDFRLKEMEKWLKTSQMLPKSHHSSSSTHHHHHHARRKMSFEHANPTKSYCCLRCQQTNNTTVTPHYPDLPADLTHDDEVVPVSSPPLPRGSSPRSTRPTNGTPRSRDSMMLRRASTGSSSNIRATTTSTRSPPPQVSSPPRSASYTKNSFSASYSASHTATHSSTHISRSKEKVHRSDSDDIEDNSSTDDLHQGRRRTIVRSASVLSNRQSVRSTHRRSSMISLGAAAVSTPEPMETPGSPAPLPIPYRPSLLFGGTPTEEPAGIVSDPSASEDQSPPNGGSSTPEEEGGSQPKLRRRRSCIKRTDSIMESKRVSWAVNPDMSAEIEKYVEAAATEVEKSEPRYEEMRMSYLGHVGDLDALHNNVAQSLERIRAEAAHLESLQKDILLQREKLQISFENMEKKCKNATITMSD